MRHARAYWAVVEFDGSSAALVHVGCASIGLDAYLVRWIVGPPCAVATADRTLTFIDELGRRGHLESHRTAVT
jgi:hypothetical protein